MCSLELNRESSKYTKNKTSAVIILLFTRSTQQRRWWQKLQLLFNASAAEANFFFSLANNYHILSLLSLQLISWARSALMVAFYLRRMHFFVNFPTWDNENDFLFGREREKSLQKANRKSPQRQQPETHVRLLFLLSVRRYKLQEITKLCLRQLREIIIYVHSYRAVITRSR